MESRFYLLSHLRPIGSVGRSRRTDDEGAAENQGAEFQEAQAHEIHAIGYLKLLGLDQVLIPYRVKAKVGPYEEAVRAAGLQPLAVEATGPANLNGCSGLLLAGGTDVDPKLYGQAAGAETDQPDDERDQFELSLIRQAEEQGLPVLAICRGMQILNVFYGGTLIQHLDRPDHDAAPECKSDPAHEVEFRPATRLLSIAETERWQVNSRHHQGVDVLGDGLVVSARALNDETIEAVERGGNRFVVAVQWHPEDQVRQFPEQLKLFRSFAQAIRSSYR